MPAEAMPEIAVTIPTKANINIKMIDQGSSELNIIIGVKEKYFEDAIKVIYDAFITNAAPAK